MKDFSQQAYNKIGPKEIIIQGSQALAQWIQLANL